MKKILLLTASYGTGHVTASKSVKKALSELYPNEIEANMLDFIKCCKNDNKSDGTEKQPCFFEKIYNFSMEYPLLWHLTFIISNTRLEHFYFRWIFPLFYGKLEKIFIDEKPDLCITTHPYWNFLIDNFNRHNTKKLKYMCIITDSTLIHNTWISPEVDYYVVCDSDTQAAVEAQGIDKNKIFVKGFPVDPKFSEKISRDTVLTELGLDPKKLTFLMVVGLGDTKKFLKLIDFLANKENPNFQFIIITGKYKNIYDMLAPRKFTAPVKVIGWTDRMADFIKSSDLIISKGGGAIVMETLAAGKPVFIPVFTPGQELGNAKLIKKYGLGFVEINFEKSTAILNELISNPALLQETAERIKKYSKPGAAKEIAKFAYEIVNKALTPSP